MSSSPGEHDPRDQTGAHGNDAPGNGPAGGQPDAGAPDLTASDMTSTMSLGGPDIDEAQAPDSDQALAESLPSGGALLVVRRGPNAGSRFVLEVPLVTAGRHPDSDIFLDDVTVSRRHAQFVHDPAGYRVKDVGSLNGTYVNRQRIDDIVLANGDEVQIGKYRLVYMVGPEHGDSSHHGHEPDQTRPAGGGSEAAR
jgi:hypothetical protein